MQEQRDSVTATAHLDDISRALHDLCQPLTVLQCRLEMGKMGGTPDDYREAVEEALAECTRLFESVAAMREVVRVVRAARDGEAGAHR